MVSRKSMAMSVFLFTLVAALFPSVSCAIQTGNAEDPRPSFLVDIKVTVKTTFPNGSIDTEIIDGTGAFVAQDLVVTAAHVIDPPPLSEEERQNGTQRAIMNVFVIGTNRNGENFTLMSERYRTISDLHPGEESVPLGRDIAILEISDPSENINNVDVLPLPHEVHVNVSEQGELIGTVYGSRIPDRAAIEEGYEVFFDPDGQLTDVGREEFEENPYGQVIRRRMATELVMDGVRPNRVGQPAPFVRLRIPHSPQGPAEPNLFAGVLPERATLTFDMAREDYINNAVRAAERLPFHAGDSGSPFVSRSPSGQPYLAGVVSSLACQGCRIDGEGDDDFKFTALIATEDLRELLRDGFERDADLDRYRNVERNISLWNDPLNNVPTADTWSDDNNTRLNGLENDGLASVSPLLCSPNASVDLRSCRYLQRAPGRTYEVTAEYIFLSGPEAATNGSGEFRVSGQIGFYSPQNYDYNSVTSSPTDEPAGYAFNVPSGAPRRMLVNERQDNGRNDSEVATVRSSETVTISAAEHNPIICLATSRTVGLLTSGGFVLVPPSEESCIIPSSTNRSCTGDNETHAIWLGGEEEGALVFVDITPNTQNDEDIVIAFLGRVWQLPFGLI